MPGQAIPVLSHARLLTGHDLPRLNELLRARNMSVAELEAPAGQSMAALSRWRPSAGW